MGLTIAPACGSRKAADMITGHQLAAARVLLGMTQRDVATRANVTLGTLRRIEGSADRAWGMPDNVDAVRAALEAAGVQFIPENGGGAGVRLRKRS
jgi:transcriptional regulator with XRE-family HTH domain